MIGRRLREERERLGLTQPAFADIADVKKGTVINWEKGVSSPTAEQLDALGSAGVDVTYVLTGEYLSVVEARLNVLLRQLQQGKAEALSLEQVDNRERALLGFFRASTEKGMQAIESTAMAVEKIKRRQG